MSRQKRVLILSSLNPTVGSGTVALDFYRAFVEAGYVVDLLTLAPVDGHPEFMSVYNRRPGKFHHLGFRLWKKLRRPDADWQHCLFYRRETDMPVPIRHITRRLKPVYDYVLVVFWQGMLTFKTIGLLYDYLGGPQFLFSCADYSPVTGGCHFIGDCKRYYQGCGCCPMLKSSNPDDFTRKNVVYRRQVYERIKPFVLANTYMSGFFSKSKALAENTRIEFCSILLNLDEFRPFPKKESRNVFGVQSEKFVIFFGSQWLNDSRKGFALLLESLAGLRKMLSDDEAARVHLLIAGHSIETVKDRLPFSYTHTGFVPMHMLPQLYSAADVYLSPSVNDAGPSMVNQSIACGTPVVAFEMGTALDVIKNHNTGVCVPLGNVDSFAHGIQQIMRLATDCPDKYTAMRAECRRVAEEYHSYSAFVSSFERMMNIQ